jgi:hypothetical protein
MGDLCDAIEALANDMPAVPEGQIAVSCDRDVWPRPKVGKQVTIRKLTPRGFELYTTTVRSIHPPLIYVDNPEKEPYDA